MKCLRNYRWVKLPRDYPDMGKGLMAQWARLASRAAFKKGSAKYAGHINPVVPGMWAGGVSASRAFWASEAVLRRFRCLIIWHRVASSNTPWIQRPRS